MISNTRLLTFPVRKTTAAPRAVTPQVNKVATKACSHRMDFAENHITRYTLLSAYGNDFSIALSYRMRPVFDQS